MPTKPLQLENSNFEAVGRRNFDVAVVMLAGLLVRNIQWWMGCLYAILMCLSTNNLHSPMPHVLTPFMDETERHRNGTPGE